MDQPALGGDRVAFYGGTVGKHHAVAQGGERMTLFRRLPVEGGRAHQVGVGGR
jgi:hypothetical protein